MLKGWDRQAIKMESLEKVKISLAHYNNFQDYIRPSIPDAQFGEQDYE